MACLKTKEPEFVYFIKSKHYLPNTFNYRGPYAGRRPVTEHEELVKYRLIKVENN